MPAQDKATLKGYFNNGDIPNESNFVDLIDSFLDYSTLNGNLSIDGDIFPLAGNVGLQQQINNYDVYNIKTYGALGDGIADDTDAINSAINDCVYGGIVYFPPGIYKINSPIVVNKSIYLKGSGCGTNNAGTKLIQTHSFSPVIGVENDDIRISDFYILTTGAISGIVVQKTSNFLTRCNISNIIFATTDSSNFVAITYDFAGIAEIKNVYSNGGRFIIRNGCTTITLNNCYAQNITGVGYTIQVSHYISLLNCAADACTTFGYDIAANTDSISLLSCGAEGCGKAHTALEGNNCGIYNCFGTNNGITLDGTTYLASGIIIFNAANSNTIIGFKDASPSNAGVRTANIQIKATASYTTIIGGSFDLGISDLGTFTSKIGVSNSVLGISSAASPSTSGTISLLPSTSMITITPTGNCVLNITGGRAGQTLSLFILTSGIASYTITFNTNFRSAGVLTTSTTTGTMYVVNFIYSGSAWVETSRTGGL